MIKRMSVFLLFIFCSLSVYADIKLDAPDSTRTVSDLRQGVKSTTDLILDIISIFFVAAAVIYFVFQGVKWTLGKKEEAMESLQNWGVGVALVAFSGAIVSQIISYFA